MADAPGSVPGTLNTRTVCASTPAWASSEEVAAATSSTSAAFCCVMVSICATASLTWVMPRSCSSVALLISPTSVPTWRTTPTDSPSVCCARVDSRVPSSTLLAESSISVFTSLAAVAVRLASARTSAATTAKPRPWSPARAASTAAFKARMLVWKAMP